MNTILSDPCLICDGPTKGLHFQVASCRACAAFFRRSIQAEKIYRCQRGDGHCNLKLKERGKTLCKYCRMQKCKQLGMKLEKDTEILPKLETMEIEDPNTNQKNVPNFEPPNLANDTIEYNEKEKIHKIIIDAGPLDNKIKEILGQSTATMIDSRLNLTFMQQLCFGFSKFYDEIKPKGQVVITQSLDKMCHFDFIEKYMVELAKVLMCCEKFAQLPFNDKFKMYKNLRPIFQTLERHWSSVLHFGLSYDDLRLLIDNKTAIDYGTVKLKFKNVDPEMFKKTMPLWLPIRDKNIKFLMRPMKAIQLTEYELVFLLAHILWTVQDISDLGESAIRISEEITEQIASELHNYYTYEMRISNYAPRIVKITKLIDAAKEIRHAKQDVTTIAKIFDMFHFEFVGSELTEL